MQIVQHPYAACAMNRLFRVAERLAPQDTLAHIVEGRHRQNGVQGEDPRAQVVDVFGQDADLGARRPAQVRKRKGVEAGGLGVDGPILQRPPARQGP
ncbi:hypothetical protein D3C73_880840 [compost metagenome]